MKVDRKAKVEKRPPQKKAVKGARKVLPKTNGKHPLAAYEHIPIGIVETSLEGKYVNVNEEFCRILGHSREELLQLGIKDCTHEDDYGIDSKLYDQLVAGKIPFYRLEKRFTRKSGGVIWVELTRTLVCDTKGKPLYTMGVVLDISDRKDVEKVLRESAERLRLATETARMFMWEWDFQTYSYIVADNFEQVLGFSTNLLAKNRFETIGSLIPAEDVQVISEAFESAVANRRDLHSLSCRVISPETGQMVWLDINAKIVYSPEGTPERMFGVAQNVTQSRQTLDALQVSRERAEHSADRTARLQKVTAALSEALSPIQVAEAIVQQGASAFGAVSSSVMLLSEGGQSLELMYSNVEESLARPYQHFPISLNVPVADAVRTHELIWIESQQQYLARYPHLADQIKRWGQQAAMAVPMVYKGRTIGALTLSFDRVLKQNVEDENYVLTLARQGAHAFERTRAEDALRESEERFRALVSQATAGIAQSAIDSRLTFVNPRFCEMLGYSEEELLGKTIFELTYKDDVEENKRLFQRMLDKGEPYQFEKRFLRKDGSTRWTNVSVTTIHDSAGKPKGGVGVMIDIEERKQAEQALAEFARKQEALYLLSNQLHRTDSLADVFDAALEAILKALQCDRASILLYDNTDVMRFVAWRGLSDAYREATDGHSPWTPDTRHPQPITMDDVRTAELDEPLRKVIQEEGIGALAFIPLLVDEKLIGKFMIYYDAPHAFDEAELDLGLTIARQLAFGIDRKRAEARLSQSEERFRQAANAAGALVYEVDLISGASAVVHGLESLTGYNPQETPTSIDWWRSLIHPDDLPAHLAQLDTLLKNGGTDVCEYRVRHKNGSWIVVQDNRLVVQSEAGDFVRLVGAVIDITERKRIEEALRIENERFMRFVNSNIVGILIGDASGRVILANDYYLNLLGVRREALLAGQVDWKQFTPPEWLPADEKAIQELRARGVCEPYEKEYIRMDGTRVPIYIADALLPGSGEEIASFVIDISERKRAEAALRESEQRYRFIVENTSDGIWWIELTDPMPISLPEEAQIEWYYKNAVIRQCNLGLARMYGYNAVEDVIGVPLRELMPGENPLNLELTRDFIRSGYRLVDSESHDVAADGRELVFLNNMIGIVEDGKLKGEWGTNRNITERKRAEEALRQSEERYRGIVNQTIGGIAETDLTGKFIMVNERYCQITGYTRNQLLGDLRMQDITHPDDRQRNLELFSRLTADGNPFEIEKRYIRSDGSIVWVHNSVSAIISADGKPHSAVAAVIDVTERKRTEEALRRNERMFSTLIDTAPFGVYFIDSEFRLRAINKGSQAVFRGIDPLIGRDFAEVLRVIWKEPFATEAIERFRHTLRTGESFVSQPVVEERANIDEIEAYDWQIHRITFPDGTYGVVCYFYDLSEQKQMEATVRASESLYRAIARNIPGGGVYVVDKDFRYVVAEGPVTEAFGLSREILEGRTVTEVFPDERGKRMEDRLRRNFAGEIVGFETKFNGRVYWTQQAPLHDSLEQVIILTLDITERKQAEEALRESEERFRAILRQATAGIVRKDAEGSLIFVNEAFCNMLGYTEAELIGKTMWDFMHEDDVAENKRSYEQLMREGIPSKLERRLLRQDGSVIWVDASVSPILDAAGKPQSAVTVEVDIAGRKQAEEALRELNTQLESRVQQRTAMLNDAIQTLRDEITERRKVEEALRKSEAAARGNEEKLSTLFELLPVGISFLDLQGQIIQMNSALANILKLSKETLIEREYESRKYIRANGTLMPPNEFASRRALEEKKTIYNVETGILLENSEVIWTSVSAAPVNVADVGAVVVTSDITESKRAERALQESRERLQMLSQRLVEVQEEERRAIARELHDRVGQTLAALNINLIIISGQLAESIDEQISTRLSDSMKLVAETIALVRDVMSNLRPSVLDDYGLEAAIESYLSQYTSRYEIDTKFERPEPATPRLGPSMEMTFLRIAQEALMNIARHAQATQVELSLWHEEDAICMTIQDNGKGIQSWQEANRPGSHGLTIMRERAEAFGGTLRVSSVYGKGTKVDVKIPVETNDASPSQKEVS